MDNGQVTSVKKRFERGQAGVEAEEAVQVDGCLAVGDSCRLGDADTGTQRVVLPLAKGNHDVEPVGSTPLEDADQDLLARTGAPLFQGERRSPHETGNEANAKEAQACGLQKVTSCEWRHTEFRRVSMLLLYLLWNSGDARTKAVRV